MFCSRTLVTAVLAGTALVLAAAPAQASCRPTCVTVPAPHVIANEECTYIGLDHDTILSVGNACPA